MTDRYQNYNILHPTMVCHICESGIFAAKSRVDKIRPLDSMLTSLLTTTTSVMNRRLSLLLMLLMLLLLCLFPSITKRQNVLKRHRKRCASLLLLLLPLMQMTNNKFLTSLDLALPLPLLLPKWLWDMKDTFHSRTIINALLSLSLLHTHTHTYTHTHTHTHTNSQFFSL